MDMLLPIYSSLNFSTTASPSLACLQWSGDGQVFFVTKNSVFIMTPNYTPALRAPDSKANTHDRPLTWFRTTIEIDRKQVQNWANLSQDWTAVVLGSLDVSLLAIAVSPSNVAKDAGCIICVLSSDMDLTLWGPTKNRFQGEWTKIQELTSLLMECYHEPVATARALQAQATSLTWSPQADFGIDPAPVLDASLLVVGTRGGTLHFLRFESDKISCVVKIKVSSDWLTNLAFSPWSLVEPGRCQALLAYGTSTGSVGLVTITQSLDSHPSNSAYGPTFSATTRMEHQAQKLYNQDRRSLTALTWVVSNDNLILVACKSGMISLWSSGSCNLGWSGMRSLFLDGQKLSVGSSPLHPVSGLHYVPHEDALITSLSDGSIHVVHNISSEPTLISNNDNFTSETLSKTARSAFIRIEPGDLKSSDVNRITGLLPYGYATVLWAHELCQPTDFGYNYDSQRHNMLIAAQLYQYPTGDVFLQELVTTLTRTKTTLGHSPLHLLRPCLLYLTDHPEAYSQVIKLLQCPPAIKLNLSLGNVTFSPDGATRREFRQNLMRYLFGWDVLLQLRLKLAIADLLLRSMPGCSDREQYEQTACHLFRAISQIILRILIRHLTPVALALTANDAPFVLRVINQSTFPGCPPDLIAEAKKLGEIIHTALPSIGAQNVHLQNVTNESCPACGVEILLENGAHAVCAKGHAWGRCSITSFILSTAMVRRCVGCSRKALLPLSCDHPDTENWLPQLAQNWVVEELLEAAARCLFCGNIFTSVL